MKMAPVATNRNKVSCGTAFFMPAKEKTIIGGSCHKYHFCRGMCLSRQNTSFHATRVCRGQICVCHDKTRLFTRQKYACRDKIMFVAISILLSRQK